MVLTADSDAEQMPREPVNPYGASKVFFGEAGEIHPPQTHLIPLALAASTENGPELQVHGCDYLTGDGTCVWDYIHVNDLPTRTLKHCTTWRQAWRQEERRRAGAESGDRLGTFRT